MLERWWAGYLEKRQHWRLVPGGDVEFSGDIWATSEKWAGEVFEQGYFAAHILSDPRLQPYLHKVSQLGGSAFHSGTS